MTRDVHDELRARLREAAEAHRPDRARILARIEHGMSDRARADHRARPRPALGWLRVAGATAAVAGVLAVGGYAVASAVKEEAPPPQGTVAASPTPAPSPEPSRPPAFPADPTPGAEDSTRRPDPTGGATASGTPAPRTPSATPETPARPPASGAEDGPLWSDGSVDPHSHDFWAQSNLTLRTSEELAALTVRLEIAQTGGVSSTGAWRSLPEEDFTLTVEERGGLLRYTWVLKAGRTVPAGEWVFAGQYDHERGGRDAGDDRYSATATTADGERLAVAGGFAPQGDPADADR
ncbi:hypothetical protein [Streptomyces sp. enrichment culture]|uniref:hypothetical protein n=1 Tax=Streptomyces sp. enrichment culture TaxID=1795815 RepID=UPI003F5552FA